jgi:adenosylcobinamide kinase/adenosylcobinamide-phosphate guanylyltransferase
MLTLVLGGAKSGKSRYAQSLCIDSPRVVFLATARDEGDPEMRARINRHRAERSDKWITIEEPLAIVRAVGESEPSTTVLLDCVTMWVANLAWEHRSLQETERQKLVMEEVSALAKAAGEREVVAVSNEVGSGIVPDHPAGRHFRDLQGIANQHLAREAGHVVLMVSGLPLTLKDERPS